MTNVLKKISRIDISCILSAFAFITICSKSSFLYPLNDWGDVNCYFIIAKGIVRGMVPYRDLIDQKGPAIFFIYVIAVLISGSTYLGVYILELIAFYLFLKISLAMLNLYIDADKYCFVITPAIAATVCSSYNFCHGGSVEELFLFAFAYGVYLLLRYIEKDQMPNKGEMLIWGLMAGVMFFTKFSLCIIYVWAILFMIIWAASKKELKPLFGNALFFVAGCLVISVLIIIYFAANNSLSLFYENYFYNSIFSYLSDDSDMAAFIVKTRIVSFLKAKRNILFFSGIILEIVWMIKKRKMFILAFLLLSIGSYFYMHFILAFAQKYYGLPFCIYGILGICFIIELFEDKGFELKPMVAGLFFCFMMLVSFAVTDNRYMMLKDKDSRVQTVYAKMMQSYGYEDFHMLYFGNLDQGFYVASGTMPNCPVFDAMNILGDNYFNAQKQYIEDKKVEFIVTYSILCDTDDYEENLMKYGEEKKKDIVTFDDFAYELIDERPQYFETWTETVKLYKIAD